MACLGGGQEVSDSFSNYRKGREMSGRQKRIVEACLGGGQEVADAFLNYRYGKDMTEKQAHIVEACTAGGQEVADAFLNYRYGKDMTEKQAHIVEAITAGGQEVADAFLNYRYGKDMTEKQAHIVEACTAGGQEVADAFSYHRYGKDMTEKQAHIVEAMTAGGMTRNDVMYSNALQRAKNRGDINAIEYLFCCNKCNTTKVGFLTHKATCINCGQMSFMYKSTWRLDSGKDKPEVKKQWFQCTVNPNNTIRGIFGQTIHCPCGGTHVLGGEHFDYVDKPKAISFDSWTEEDDSFIIREYKKGVSQSLDVPQIINVIARKLSTIRSTDQLRRRLREIVGSKTGIFPQRTVWESLDINLRISKGESLVKNEDQHSRSVMYNQRLEEYANFVFEDKYKDIKQAIKKSDNNRESLNILFNLASETQMEQIKTLKSRLVPYISQESRNGGSLTKDIITKFGDDFAEILRPVLRAVGTQKNKRWVLRDKESTDGGDSEEVVSKSKVKKCLMLVRAMMSYLSKTDRALYEILTNKLKSFYFESFECTENKFNAKLLRMVARLHETIGEDNWNDVNDYVAHYYMRKKQA